MRYRPGEFHPTPGSGVFAWMQRATEIAEPMRKVLEEMLQVRLSSVASDSTDYPGFREEVVLPDLLPVTSAGADAVWVDAVHDRLRYRSRSADVRLLACEYEPGPDGFLCIGATSPSVADEVVPGDRVQAGFAALRDRERPLRIFQRIFRVVCDNGSIVSVHDAEVATDSSAVVDLVDRCFDSHEFARHVEAFRLASQTASPDPRMMLDEVQRLWPAMARRIRSAWMRRFRLPNDERPAPTIWNLLNDVTEVARDLPDWRQRIYMEETAGHLAKLLPPQPRKTPGRALELVAG